MLIERLILLNFRDEQLEQTSLPALNNRLDSCVFHRLSFDEESLDHSEDISQRSIVDSYEMGTMELTVPKIVVR